MGMGRNSSRIATRRIANYNGDELDQLIEQTGLISSNRLPEHSKASSVSNNSNANSDDLMSIINSVATANNHSSTEHSSSLDSNFSSYSNSFSSNNDSLKPPNAKKKRVQNAKNLNSISLSKPVAQIQFNLSQGKSTNLLPNSNATSN